MLTLAKAFTGFGGFVTLLIGLAFLAVTIWAFVNKVLAFNQNQFLVFVLIADIVIILGSLIGIIGIKKQNGCMIFIFQILVAIFCLTFLSIGITAEVAPKVLFNQECTSNHKNKYLQIAFTAYNESNTKFCSNSCPCGLDKTLINNNPDYNASEKAFIDTKLNITNNNILKYQDCENSTKNQTIRNMFNILEGLETAFSCSGWCRYDNKTVTTNTLFYKFSNVNRGKPHEACYDTMKDTLFRYGNIFAMFAFACSAFMLILVLCSLCICCSRK